MANSDSTSSPARTCGACRYNGKGCKPDCIYAPYFPHEDDVIKFECIQRVYEPKYVIETLEDIPELHRKGAIESFHLEALWRIKDPVYGITKLTTYLENVHYALEKVKVELSAYTYQLISENLDVAYMDSVDYALHKVITELKSLRTMISHMMIFKDVDAMYDYIQGTTTTKDGMDDHIQGMTTNFVVLSLN